MSDRIDQVPLRIKLVAASLALVTASLLVIGVSSTVTLRSYLTNRVDSQLTAIAGQLPAYDSHLVTTDSNLLVAWYFPDGTWTVNSAYQNSDLPPLPNLAEARAAQTTPYMATSINGKWRWRLVIDFSPGGSPRLVGENMATVDSAVSRLVLSEVLVGLGVLILLAVLGAAMVRASLRPLHEIEQTARAIVGGDLTQRVPEYEPETQEPRTEVGRVGRALNTMLGYLETAFQRQTESESAARYAQAAAQDAAVAAQQSEVRARRSEERMRQFVADASHELRTPLTTIRGFAELYRQGAARQPEAAEKLVRRIEDEAARMGLLVEDLLLLARLDAERPLEPVPLELRVIGSDAVTAAQAIAPDRKISLEIPPGTGPLIVDGDEARLRQVVGNLMSNALTYTPAGSPVAVRLLQEGELAVIEVADEGPGLDPVQAEKVFERFYRADVARTRKTSESGPSSGTGLGLAIVAAIVAAHNGTVRIESTPGAGATFRVELPIQRQTIHS